MQLFKTQNEEKFIQKWYYINVDNYVLEKKIDITGVYYRENTNKRVVAISYPNNYNKNKIYSYVLNFDFNIDGRSSDWFQFNKEGKVTNLSYKGMGGIIPYNVLSANYYKNYGKTGLPFLMKFFKDLVNNDVIIIHTSMISEDIYLYIDCDKKDKPIKPDNTTSYYNNLCWYKKDKNNNKNNPDLNYLQNLFDHIYSEDFPVKLNYNNMGLIGYSVSAQAVSRYINEFPFLKTIKGHKFPKINCAVMIAGGSYFCYDDKFQSTHIKQYKDCTSIKEGNVGCCPNNITEENYSNGKLKWKNHPPVLLIQQSQDWYADPNASIFYEKIMKNNYVLVKRISSNSDIHGLSSYKQSDSATQFILKYLNIHKNKKNNILLYFILLLSLILVIITIRYIIYKQNNYL